MNSANPFEGIVSEHYEALYRFALALTRAEADAQSGALVQVTAWNRPTLPESNK